MSPSKSSLLQTGVYGSAAIAPYGLKALIGQPSSDCFDEGLLVVEEVMALGVHAPGVGQDHIFDAGYERSRRIGGGEQHVRLERLHNCVSGVADHEDRPRNALDPVGASAVLDASER